MPQALPLPDGRFVTIREGETPAQTWERAQRMYPEAFGIKEPEKKETTVGGQAKEFFKGLAPGAINLVESAAIGASALLPEETEKAARSGIASLASSAKKPFEATAGYEDTVGRKFGEAAGSIIPFLGLGPLGVAGRVGMGALGAGAGAGEARTRAEEGGATEGQRAGATALGTVVGISEMFAPARILGRISEPVKDGAVSYVKRALMAGGEEAAQEAASQAAQNLISKGIYKPDQEIIEGVGESAAYGGAVGALAQGLFDLALGRRAKGAGTPQQEEFAKLRAEEEKRLEEERKRKTTPEYAQEVVQKYDALAKQKQDLIAQIKKIEKMSPTADADRAFNTQLNAQIKALSKEIEPLADDYYKAKGVLNQIAEQERVAKLTPQEYAFGLEPETEEQKKEQIPELYEQQIATPPKPPAELTSREKVAEYANQRIALANEQMNTAASFAPKFRTEATKDYVDYLMQDPELAQQIVETRPTLAGLPTDKKGKLLLSNAEVLDALKLQVKPLMDAKKKAEIETFQTEMDVRKGALGATKTVEEEDQSVAALRDWMDESRDKFQPSTDSDFNYLNGMFESAFKGQPQPIAVNENLRPLREAPTVRKTVEELLDIVDTADREQRSYRTAGNRAAAVEAIKRRDAASNQLNAMSAEQPAGAETKGLKRGPAEQDIRASYARELIAARRGQQEAMAKLEDATSGIRSEQTLGRDVTGANTEAGLIKRANDAQAQFIRNALQEAAIHRRAAGKPALTTDEALKAASKIHDTFNDWISRSTAKPEKTTQYDLTPIRERVNRSGQTVTTYRVSDKDTYGPVDLTFIRQKDGTIFRIFSRYMDGKGGGSEFDTQYDKSVPNQQIIQGAFLEPEIFNLGKEGPAFTGDLNELAKLSEAEVKHFKAIAETVRNKLSEEAPSKVQRVEAGPLRRQFATEEAKKTAEAKGETATTLGGQLRRRKEYVSNLLDRALALKNLPEGGKFEYTDVDGKTSVVQVKGMREALERAKDMIEDGIVDTRLLDAAENQAERVLRGQDLGQVTRMGREQIAEGRQVVRNVPGKEASTEIGRRGQKFVTTGKLETAEQEKATFPKGAPVAVEANEALRELEEAIALNERVAQEKAGQKSLFPEVEEDLGYIRATPANFAKSPRMKPVWEALAKARVLFKESEQKRVAREATRKNRLRLLEQITERMDSIRNDTKFFWTNSENWSSKAIAETFARSAPDAGKTPEEKRLLQKYVQDKKSLTIQEQGIVAKALQEYRERNEFQARMKEAFALLAQGRRLYDIDNQLLAFMQDTNESIRKASKEMNDSMAGLRDTVEYLKEVMKVSVLVTPEQQALIDSEIAIKRQRASYQTAVEDSIKRAREDMDEALGFLLDPIIAKTSDNLKAAETTLAKEQADLDKIKKRFDSVLAQEDGANRTELATYELFRYEEKKSIIDDLQKQVKERTAELQELLDERSTKYDGGVAVAQAMLDNKVKFERQYLEMLEANLATMRGENVLDRPGAYPFAYQQAKKNADVQQKIVKAAEKRVTAFKEIAKSEQQKIEDVWQSKDANVTAGEGIQSKRRKFLPEERKQYEAYDKQVEALQDKYDAIKDQLLNATGKAKTGLQKKADKAKADLSEVIEKRSALLRRTMQVSKLATAEEKQATKLREEAMASLDRQAAAAEKDAVKEVKLQTYGNEMSDLLLEAESIPGPDDTNELRKIIDDETQSDNTRIMAMAKLGVLQSIDSVEAQYEVEQEGAPRRKQRAATALSSVGQAKGKPLRTGSFPASQSIKTLLSPEKKRERVKDTLDLGAFVSSDDVRGIFGGGRTSVDFSEARTQFDLDFDAMSMGPTFTYKGAPVAELADVEQRSLLGDLHNMYMRTASTDPKVKFDAAKSRILVGLRSDVALFKNSNPALSARVQKRVDFLESVTADDIVITIPGGGFRGKKQTATLAPAKLKANEPLKVSDSTVNSKFNQLGVKLATDIGYNGLSFAQAAEYGAKRAKNANQKILFERLQEIFADAKPDKYSGRVFASETAMHSYMGSAAGYYIPSLDMVIVSEAKLDPMQTLLHELVHAASVKMLSQDKALDNRVTVLRERVEQWSFTPEGEAWLTKNFRQTTFDGMPYFPDLYGLTNNKEFLAETFANPEFQKMLAEIPSDMPRKSLLTRLVEFLSRSFSMPAKAMQSLFAESMVLTEEIMQRTKTEIYEAGVDPRSNSLPAPLIAYDNPEFNNVRATMKKVVAQDKTWWDSIKANTSGLAFETQLVDRFAGFERLAKYMEPLKGTQMLYYLRSYDQRMNIVSKAVSDGAPAIREITRDDGRVERLVETTGGASIAGVVDKLKDAKQYIGNGDAVNQVFTTYMAAIRAKNKGIETLNFGTDENGKPVLTQEMLDEVTNLVNKNAPLKKIFGEAREEYNKYNRDLLDFVASTGALSKTLVKKLVAEDDYIPFYRERKGVVELVIGNENPIRIGSIAEQPYLDKLVGGDTAIIDFMTSSVQNTNMLVDMGMRNLATKNAVMELVDLKAATLVKKADGPDVVKFKVEGDDRYAIIATEKVMIGNKEFETGVPADLLVKGMEGIPTQMPFLFRVMAMPAQVLRKAITLSPLYMAKQLFRDSLAAPILSGADFTPVLGALKEINGAAKEKLEKRGIVGGQYFRGTSEDMSMILREISDGKPGWMTALGRFEALGMEADALTRRAQYNSYIEQGLSEMEATLMSLESMNFNKRGASPSVHVANALIPFFNAQIQGLNVMYKAMSGNMPFNDQLRIREKMLQRGGMMAAATFAYAVMMEDDDAYKNATPDQKYGNWFIRLPGLDEPVKVPVPFEIGYIFKAIPEALYNSMTTEHGGEEAVKAFKQILLQTVPGGSSYGIPQAAKPLIEVGLGKSFYTGRDILSAREKQLLPEEQYRVNTTDAAKLVGSTLGVSPIKMEALVSGYTGTMGLAFLQAISLGVPAKETPERAVRRLSEYPILGGAFQPNDAGGIINSVYERMNDVLQVKNTVNKLVEEGKVQEAQALITKRGTDYMQAELANTFKANMNMLTQAERAIAASKMTPEAKREQLDKIRKIKIGLANTTREISDKTIRLIGGS